MKTTQEIQISGRVRIIASRASASKILRLTDWMQNLVVSGTNTGRNLIAQRLGGQNTYTLNVTHADIGTGTNAPANSDIALQTPTVRSGVANQIVAGNVVTLQFFFPDSLLPNGTYQEFGTFIDGASTISTGKLFNRILFGTPYVKNAGEDTTVEVQFTIS